MTTTIRFKSSYLWSFGRWMNGKLFRSPCQPVNQSSSSLSSTKSSSWSSWLSSLLSSTGASLRQLITFRVALSLPLTVGTPRLPHIDGRFSDLANAFSPLRLVTTSLHCLFTSLHCLFVFSLLFCFTSYFYTVFCSLKRGSVYLFIISSVPLSLLIRLSDHL